MMLYLHGFRSSPQSYKSRLMAQAMLTRNKADQWLCPALPASPKAAIQQAEALLAEYTAHTPAEHWTLIGSSLGGYYATWLAERWGTRAVLLNPVVHAVRDLATQVGVHTAYHDHSPFVFTPDHVQELAALQVGKITRPERYYLLAAKGDELLDWQEMVAHYPGATHRILEGSDHGLSDFADWLPEVLAFADPTLTPSRTGN